MQSPQCRASLESLKNIKKVSTAGIWRALEKTVKEGGRGRSQKLSRTMGRFLRVFFSVIRGAASKEF